MSTERIIVVGAGPVGLVAAASLVDAGIPVVVVEAQHGVAEDLRASTFHPPTLDILDRFGVVGPLIEIGLICPHWQYRDRRRGAVATFDLTHLAGETAHPYRLQCEQWKLTRMLRDRLERSPLAAIIYEARATDVSQTADEITLGIERPNGATERITGRYLIGADGARSAIRKSLGVAFDGITIPELYLSMSTTFAFDRHIPDLAAVAYISDPDEWLVLLRTPSLWRVLIPTDPAEPDDRMLAPARIEQRMQAVLASATPYEVVHKTAYRVQERVAERYVVGRALLAGDAAHVNNPLGGMGMNGGIHDAVNLTDKLIAVWRGADAALLGRYERQRRKVAIETVQAQALRNRQIMNERDEGKRQAYHDELRATADDPVRARDYLLRTSMIQSLRELEQVA